jgi:hypothetical protein
VRYCAILCTVQLRVTEIDELVRRGLLPGEMRNDRTAIANALHEHFDRWLQPPSVEERVTGNTISTAGFNLLREERVTCNTSSSLSDHSRNRHARQWTLYCRAAAAL